MHTAALEDRDALSEARNGDRRNPFTLPSDEEVFRMRDEERKRREEEKKIRRGQKVWEKGSNRGALMNTRKLGGILKSSGSNIIDGTNSGNRRTQSAGGLPSGLGTAVLSKERRQDKESMAEFIAKKREMFLVQMSLDTKREEIRKLEEKARTKEEALKKSEQMLEEDALRFDTFLKENDRKAHEAIKRAERETKLKNDKLQEIKKLNQQIQMVQSDMSKHRESLEDCLKYKAFLDMLTPPEWFEQQQAAKRARQEARRVLRLHAKRKAWEDEKRRLLAEFQEEERKREDVLTKQGRVKKKSEKKTRGPETLPPMPRLEAEPLTSSGEDVPMYFTNPSQLLDIFQALEEQNLFLIQNSQETEHALEELKQTFREAQKAMDTKTEALRTNINDLMCAIAAEGSKAEQLRRRISASTGDTLVRQEQLLEHLHTKVKEVYERCGYDARSNPTTLFMLSDLEARLEDLLFSVSQMPEEYVIKAEKDKEKKRRQRKRQEQQALHERLQVERNLKAIERSMQAPRQQTGRKVMTRNIPTRRTVQEDKEEDNDEDADELKHFR